MPQLRQYQLEAIKDILDKKKILIADDMGLGKCAESIVAKTAIEKRFGYDHKTLVVCPASVSEHWKDEIKLWYKKKNDTKIAEIQTSTYDIDVRDIKDSDFTIVGYPTLSYLGSQINRLDKLKGAGFTYGIIDEAHNAKNPASIRTISVKKLFDFMDYLAVLSGTPIPNSIVDIYMLLSLLDKDNFPVNVENSKAVLNSFYNMFRQDPEFVRRILNDRMLRRTVDDYLHIKFPELRQNNLEITLDGEHKDTYIQVYNNDDIKPASKLIQLLKASLDPNLVNPNLLDSDLRLRIGKMESSVYRALDNLVENVVDNNGKVLMFSDLKENVTGKLRKRYEKFGAVVIDGDVSSAKYGDISVREEIRRKFQNDPDCKVLISTTVMDEGVDLTAATDIVHVTLPYQPARFDQRNRRAQRIGEIKKDYVNVHVVKTSLDSLIYTITEGIEKLLDDKRRIITYILEKPFALTKRDLDEIKNGKTEVSRHLVPLIGSPVKSLFSHLTQLKGMGFNKILEHYKNYPDRADYIARLYASNWEGYYGGNTANLYAKVINALEAKENLEKKLDIASGPFSLSRIIGKPAINLDINHNMLNAGRILENDGKIVPGNQSVNGVFHQLPFQDGYFDLAVCSLALHMSRLKIKYKGKEINERELAFREINRVLRDKGYAIITLPHTVLTEKDTDNFYEGLNKLGFDVLPFSGFYKAKDSNFRVYLAGLKKISEPSKELLEDKDLTWKMDDRETRRKRISRNDKKHQFQDVKETKKEVLNEFYHSRTGKSIETCVEKGMK